VQGKTAERAFSDRLELRMFHSHWIGCNSDTRTSPRRFRHALSMRAREDRGNEARRLKQPLAIRFRPGLMIEPNF